jgi:hypothetical protein
MIARPDPITKDSFHNLIFRIDKKSKFCIINSTTLTRLSLPKGVVDGERPLRIPVFKLESPC